jgi:TRAP transporter TAXI family solute receptor
MADNRTSPTTTPPRHRLRAIVHKGVDGGGRRFDWEAFKDLFFIVLLPLVALLLAFWFAARFVKPAPPDNFTMTTGADGGAYHLFARRYRDILQREKISITLKPSAGSTENLKRLMDSQSGVEVGLLQAGIAAVEPPTGLRSLGAVYFEPLWVFYKSRGEIDKLSQLAGKRIAVGAEGSGTRVLALQLLKASGVEDSTSKLVALGGSQAADALVNDVVDAALLVAAPDAPLVQKLAKAKDVKIASLVQAEAFTRRFPFLTALQLPRGALDLANDIPARDVAVLAAAANLIVREDFHPALGFLLLQAAAEVHGRAGILQKPGEFPAAKESEFPLADEAKRYYRSGTPILQRYLPFWVANFFERIAVLLLPFVAVLLPLFKVLPALIQWRYKSRLFRWYGELKHLETQAAGNLNHEQLAGYLERLDEIEQGVNLTRVGAHYADYVYNLRLHIDLVRTRLRRLETQEPTASP